MRSRIELIIIVLLIAASLFATHLYITFYTPASREGGVRVVFIQKGTGFRVVAENLERSGVIRDAESFIFASSLLGGYKKIQAGEYEFNRSMTPLEVLDTLKKGKVIKHPVTIPEGYNIREVAATLKDAGLADDKAFIAKATDKSFVASLGIEGPTLEGYLFPDTYIFTKGLSADEIIRKMVDNFKAVYKAELEEEARKKGDSMKEVVTLASIIEKETGSPAERSLISAVFHNRLKKGIKLQSDPTVIYDIEDFDGNLTKKHLLTNSPYNTYTISGLPPGPIANPGRESLRAALSPSNGDYLYFVSKNDGTHYFSKNLKEHNRAVNEYQRHIRYTSAHKG